MSAPARVQKGRPYPKLSQAVALESGGYRLSSSGMTTGLDLSQYMTLTLVAHMTPTSVDRKIHGVDAEHRQNDGT